jgi:hypothetical protein
MRQTIKGLLAAFAVTMAGAAPAMACGYNTCGSYAPAYSYVPTYSYSYGSGCGTCGNSWGYNRLAEPTTQYYYVNQGPVYSGPGSFAPEPVYQETAIPSYGYSSYAPSYGYGYGYRHQYRPYAHHYGYARRHYGYGYGHRYGYHHRWSGEGYYGGHPLVRRYY